MTLLQSKAEPGAIPEPRDRAAGLSKSRIAAFEQCPRRLWLMVHCPDLEEVSEGSAVAFGVGHEVGRIACELEAGGVMVEAEPDLAAAIRTTQDLIAAGFNKPIFEATFAHEGVVVRVDVLKPHGDSGYTLHEVKSTAGPKAYHLGDLATQVWVLTGTGLKISSAHLRHIDTCFVLEREGDYRGFLRDAPSDPAVTQLAENRGRVVALARAVLQGPEPDQKPGPHCTDPYACGFAAHCQVGMPEPPKWPIALLPRTGARIALEWAERGVRELTEVPEGALPHPLHNRIYEATRSGVPYHNVDGVLRDTAAWAWPRVFLDFETVNLAIPRWIGTRPFQHIPFQFSAHVEEERGKLAHRAFLDLSGEDPRRACAEALLDLLEGTKAASIITYNAAFERGVILALADALPDLQSRLQGWAARIVDLLPVVRAHYYHPEQRGSFSIKAVLPVLAPELSYDGMAVADGQAAQRAWAEAVSLAPQDPQREEIRQSLLDYCERDTLAMVTVLERLTL